MLNLIQLIIAYGLGFFLIKESITLTKALGGKDKKLKWLYRFLFSIGVICPIIASVIIIERYM